MTPILEPIVQDNIDLLRTVQHSKITRTLINDLLSGNIPPGINLNIIRQTSECIDKFQREVLRNIPKTDTYFSARPNRAKIIDIITINDLMLRIGIEEHSSMYDDLLGIIVDLVDTVLYSQKHRRAIHFAKYRALFKLIVDDLRADVNRQPTQLRYIQGELFLRTSAVAHEPQIKTDG